MGKSSTGNSLFNEQAFNVTPFQQDIGKPVRFLGPWSKGRSQGLHGLRPSRLGTSIVTSSSVLPCLAEGSSTAASQA